MQLRAKLILSFTMILCSAECRVKIWQVDINISPSLVALAAFCSMVVIPLLIFHGLLLLPLFWGVWC